MIGNYVTDFDLQDNQKDLENATEQLSEYLERDITCDMLNDIKQKVQDKYRSVRDILQYLAHCLMQENSWLIDTHMYTVNSSTGCHQNTHCYYTPHNELRRV